MRVDVATLVRTKITRWAWGPGDARDAVADKQIADPLLCRPDLRVVRIQPGVEQRLAVNRFHAHARFDAAAGAAVPEAM